MTITIPSVKTESYASTIQSKYKLKAKVRSGNTLYRKKYRHLVELRFPYNKMPKHAAEAVITKIKHAITDTSSRFEYPFGRIYTSTLEDVLDELIRLDHKNLIYTIYAMDDHIYDKLITPPTEETFRTEYSVYKSLPYAKDGGGYRYKVHYTNSNNIKKKIGADSLEAIAFHLRQAAEVKWAGDLDSIKRPYAWGTNYFYCKNLDWLPVITLIDGRFIRKIEIITLESEI